MNMGDAIIVAGVALLVWFGTRPKVVKAAVRDGAPAAPDERATAPGPRAHAWMDRGA